MKRRRTPLRWRALSVGSLASALLVLLIPVLGLPSPANATARSVLSPETSTTLVTDARSVEDPLAAPEGPGVVAPLLGSASAGTWGEGVIWLTMSGPGTSWSSALNTSVVVDVSVDGGLSQQIVLFDGEAPFTYTGFTGPLEVGAHTVTVAVDRALSHTVTVSPRVQVEGVTLGVLPTTAPEYTQIAYAPVIYGRHASARSYTPLLTSAADTAGPAGGHQLEYVLLISAHDQGDSIIPAYQWGLWGRMTDIVSIVDETISSGGVVEKAAYASCGCESIPLFPDSVMAPQETTASIGGPRFFTHPVLRNASATNYLSDRGTTPFRFQQLPVAGPPPGQTREAMMDEHPWSYRISNEELPREHVISTGADNLLVGDYRQYAIVDSDLSVRGTTAVEFEIRLAGDPTWYSTDYEQMTMGIASTVPFTNGGHTRSAVKLPLSWQSRPIVGFRIRLEVKPGSTVPPSLAVHSLQVLAVTPSWTVVPVPLPTISVTSSIELVPVALPG